VSERIAPPPLSNAGELETPRTAGLLAPPARFERAPPDLEGPCSIHLSYRKKRIALELH
jgi:hypothetical protein